MDSFSKREEDACLTKLNGNLGRYNDPTTKELENAGNFIIPHPSHPHLPSLSLTQYSSICKAWTKFCSIINHVKDTEKFVWVHNMKQINLFVLFLLFFKQKLFFPSSTVSVLEVRFKQPNGLLLIFSGRFKHIVHTMPGSLLLDCQEEQ